MSDSPFGIEIEGLRELQDEWRSTGLPGVRRAMRKAVVEAIEQGAKVARSLVPVSDKPRGPHLRDRILSWIAKDDANEVAGVINAGRAYASFVENGTRPHEIRPRRVSVLAWEGSDGEGHFAKVVHHPGTQPHPFMGPAFFKAEQVLEARLDDEIQRVLDALK